MVLGNSIFYLFKANYTCILQVSLARSSFPKVVLTDARSESSLTQSSS